MASEVTSYTCSAIPMKPGSSIVASAIDPSAGSCYTLDTNGILSGMWAKSGGPKGSFGDAGFVDTKSKYVTSMALFADDFGSGSILTGGGYELMGSPGTDQAMTQGVVKQWDLVRGNNVATYMGGTGLVRCLGIPGRNGENAATTIPVVVADEGGAEEKESGEGKEGEDKEEDPYADDPTWGAMTDDAEAELAAKRKKEAERKNRRFRLNSHRLTTFVSGGDDGYLRVWDTVKTAMVAELIQDGVGAIKNIATCEARHGLVLTGHRAGSTSTDGEICIWDINGKTCMERLKNVHTSEVSAMALSPCGTKLFTAGGADDPTMKEWDLRTMKKVKNVGFHADRVLALGILTTPSVGFLTSASKDSTVGLTAVTKSGVIRSKLVAEMTDFQGWANYLSLAPMKLGSVKFAGGQKRKSTPDIFTICTDKNLRQYDLSDFISLEDATAVDAKVGDKGVEKDVSKMKLSAEDNYHAKQTEFWDNFPSSEEIHGAGARGGKGAKKGEEKADDGVERDKYGNEVGSIEYWVAKGNEPKRPKVGDIVVLAGDNVEAEEGEEEEKEEGKAEITEAQKADLRAQRLEKAEKLPAEAKKGALRFGKADLGIITKDDNSGVPFEILSGLTGEKGWYEEDHVEIASIETIKRARKENDISVASLKTGEIKKEAEEKKEKERETQRRAKAKDEDDEDDEAMGYYQEMLRGGGGHGGWGGVGGGGMGAGKAPQAEAKQQQQQQQQRVEEKASGGQVKEEETFSLSKFKPPSPPPAQTQEDVRAEQARQQAVEDSMAIYRQRKKSGAGGKRVSRF
eukprot:CAMPEP_0197546330 /NCGR_PEP_ID=MMETSP1320-20131121/972_1 /TAXON_ID=91990 /ORGANISM="Bolidomonas sp., Strain RCC2347" /LENGTH=797 /DNA_ID=CAMNT_0043105881 /DNA_START=187 /DNA_END=2580 /DNA_ORIENTATION=+